MLRNGAGWPKSLSPSLRRNRRCEEVSRGARTTQRCFVAGARLRELEILRAMHTDAFTSACGLDPSLSLVELAESIDEPWRSILLEQRCALRTAIGSIGAPNTEPVAPPSASVRWPSRCIDKMKG